ncbi:MAG: PRC-barrel domain-containing protein [Opitutales bacterium]
MEKETIRKFGFYFFDALEGIPVAATDGEIGKCADVLFYDQRGHVAYFVVDTGKWFSHNKVLIGPTAIDTGKVQAKASRPLGAIPSTLTREKVEASPPYDSEKPVSDEYRERLAEHYKWPYEVGDTALWGPSVFAGETVAGGPDSSPATDRPDSPPDPEEVEEAGRNALRSAREIVGYRVISKDDTEIGKVSDVVLDTIFSALPYLRVRENAVLKPRDLIVPWECIAGFSLSAQDIRTTLDEAILSHAPEAPAEEEFSDSSVESAIRSYYQLF